MHPSPVCGFQQHCLFVLPLACVQNVNVQDGDLPEQAIQMQPQNVSIRIRPGRLPRFPCTGHASCGCRAVQRHLDRPAHRVNSLSSSFTQICILSSDMAPVLCTCVPFCHSTFQYNKECPSRCVTSNTWDPVPPGHRSCRDPPNPHHIYFQIALYQSADMCQYCVCLRLLDRQSWMDCCLRSRSVGTSCPLTDQQHCCQEVSVPHAL